MSATPAPRTGPSPVRRHAVRTALLCLGLTGCAALPPRGQPDGARLDERQVLELINHYRRARELPALAHDRVIAGVARAHSRAMAAGDAPVGHVGLDARASTIARRLDVLDVGENLVAMRIRREVAPRLAVAAWLDSDGHRRTIEGCYDLTGVGAAYDAHGRLFVTQIFVRRADTRGRGASAAEDACPRASV